MTRSVAIVKTRSGSRYLQQLCKHWGHRFTVEFTPENGTIAFNDDQHVILKATEAAIEIAVEGPDSEIAGLEKVVEDHIKRFAFREELDFSWHRAI